MRNVKMKIGDVCVFCIKKMWQAVAAFLVIVAVIISLLKYSLPHIGSYREDIQSWVQQQYGVEISIGKLTAGWHGTGPAILLQDIAFLPNNDTPLDLKIREVRLKLDFWTTLLEIRPTSDYFILDGVAATLDARSFLRAKAMTSNTGKKARAPILDVLSQLFLGQLRQFSVTNSSIKLKTPSNVDQHLGIETLTWFNDKEHHQGIGEFNIDGFAANSLSFVLDLHGSRQDDLSGQLYIEAAELDISPWLHQFVSSDSRISRSNINFSSWVNIEQGLFGRAEINLGDNEISWSRDDEQHYLQFGNGQLLWLPVAGGWELGSNAIGLGSKQGDWPPLTFNLKQQQQKINLYFDQWSVAASLDLLTLTHIDETIAAALASYRPQGQLHDLHVEFTGPDVWRLVGQFSDLGWRNVQNIPGGAGLSGDFGITPDAGWLNLQGSEGQFLTGALFKAPIDYQNFSAELSFLRDQQGSWQLGGDNIWLHGAAMDAQAEFSLRLSGQPEIALYAEVSVPDLLVIDRFYPPQYMGDNAINYLNGAIKGGKIEMAQLLWSGPLSAFPYDNNEGIFLVNALIDEVDFLFAPDWPQLSGINGQLLFKNDGLTIIPEGGHFLNIDITHKVVARMPSLSKGDWLELDINAVESIDKVAELFANTPIKGIFNPVFAQLKVKNQVTAQAQLLFPLIGDSAYFDANFVADGQVLFADNQITLNTLGITLEQVNGLFKFHNNKIHTEDMAARWQDLSWQVELNGQQQPGGFGLNISTQTELNTESFFARFDSPLNAYVKGQIPLDSTISLVFPDSGVEYEIDSKVNLTHTGLGFPQPYDKIPGLESVLNITVKGDGSSSLISANLDRRLFFNAILPNDLSTLRQAHLIFGDDDLGLSPGDFKISVALDQAALMPWYHLVDTLVADISHSGQTALLPTPASISGKIGLLSGFGHQLHGVNFEVLNAAGSWDLLLNAKETRSTIHFDRDWMGQGISIKTDYLRLAAADDGESNSNNEDRNGNPIDSAGFISRLPPIDFSCMDCQYGQYNLQRLDIETSANKNTLNIDKFSIVKDKHQLQLSGHWLGDQGNGISSVRGRFGSDDIGRLLNEYELTSSVRDSDATIDFIAEWAGGPHQFNSPSLSGEVQWQMGEGHLTEVSDKGARLFSLLSLDSIVRKLKLDFRDVFSKGFFYNGMKGSMFIESGIAYTDNTKIDGVPGDLVLQGKTNLVDNTLDYDIEFTPKYTSSLPALIGFLVNPLSGIAALGLNEVFESKVISKVHFTLTGSMADPLVTEIERKSRDIQIPERTVSPLGPPESVPESGVKPEQSLPGIDIAPEIKPDADRSEQIDDGESESE